MAQAQAASASSSVPTRSPRKTRQADLALRRGSAVVRSELGSRRRDRRQARFSRRARASRRARSSTAGSMPFGDSGMSTWPWRVLGPQEMLAASTDCLLATLSRYDVGWWSKYSPTPIPSRRPCETVLSSAPRRSTRRTAPAYRNRRVSRNRNSVAKLRHSVAASCRSGTKGGVRGLGLCVMRVLVVTNMWPSEEEPQLGPFVKDQIDDLRRLGVDIELLYFDGRQSWTSYAKVAHTIRRRVARARFDLVHAHYALCGAAALAQRQVPVVTTFHGSDYSGAIPWQVRVSRIVARLSSPIFVSTAGAMRLPPHAAVIPAGVDVALFQPIDRDKARRRLGWQVDARLRSLPSSPLVKIKRADLFQATLKQAANDVPGLRGVYLQGYSRDRVALVMNAVDVTLLTSDWEGSPVTVRESLACQTPVVSVAVGDVPRVLAGLPGCAVVRRDPAALARSVLAALDAGRPQELRARAELSARPRTAEKVLRVYQGALRR